MWPALRLYVAHLWGAHPAPKDHTYDIYVDRYVYIDSEIIVTIRWGSLRLALFKKELLKVTECHHISFCGRQRNVSWSKQCHGAD